MRGIIEFKLPEEEVEFRQALDGHKWEVVVWSLLNACMKHGDFYRAEDEGGNITLDMVRDMINSLMDEYELHFSP